MIKEKITIVKNEIYKARKIFTFSYLTKYFICKKNPPNKPMRIVIKNNFR